MYPKLSEELKHTLKITKENLASADLTIPVFINTLAELTRKGYLTALSVFEDKYHPEILKFLDDAEYAKTLKELEKIDTSAFIEKYKMAIADSLQETAPANVQGIREEILSEEIDIKTLLDTSREALQGYTPEVVSTVVLSPFRDIERLLEKMNDGIAFEAVKDAGIWYDSIAHELHIDDTTISTSYQNKPTKAHFALQALFKQFGEPQIDYVDIPEFDLDHMDTEKKSYRDSLNRLLKKHPRLKELFTVHTGHLSIQGDFLEHPH